jgi:carbon storage regulator
MLVLTRKSGEKIHIGADIVVTVLEINGNKVRIGFDAPGDIAILRAELRAAEATDRPVLVQNGSQ